MTLYTELRDAGCEIDSHESDLYVLATPEARAIIERYGKPCLSFISQIDGKRWLDVPFMYEPFWDKKRRF